ncbi:hypothetical protein EMCRGX_G007811 [Ephydatia muelleri]
MIVFARLYFSCLVPLAKNWSWIERLLNIQLSACVTTKHQSKDLGQLDSCGQIASCSVYDDYLFSGSCVSVW